MADTNFVVDLKNPNVANAHNLLPKELAAQMPALYATENDPDPLVLVKLFTPDSSYTWYLTEYSPVAPDGTAHLAFGYTDSGYSQELGYIDLLEICGIRGHLRLKVERDLWWKPIPLSQVKADLRKAWRQAEEEEE